MAVSHCVEAFGDDDAVAGGEGWGRGAEGEDGAGVGGAEDGKVGRVGNY